MKKIVIATILGLILGFSVSAANINDLNGFDWRGWNDTQRVSFVVGFISANNMMLEYMAFNSKNNKWSADEAANFKKLMEDQFGYEVSVGDVCTKIDKFYEIYDNRTFKIWQIILYAYGKDFWNAGDSKKVSSGGA